MKIVKLTETEKIGFGLLAEKIRLGQADINRFVRMCLEQADENPNQPGWMWNEARLQWEMDVDSPDSK